uniref:Protein kinase domain-containing protein n=1 Tax=Panagrolaimus davidi TaxID=227884 RepID=A0A914PMJ8_9BILA
MSENVEPLIQFKLRSKFNGWKIVKKLEDWGGHGASYKVIKEKLPYLLKIEKTGHDKFLKHEVRVLQELAKVSEARHISKIEEAKQYNNIFYVVYTFFGKTLKDLCENAPNKIFDRVPAVSAASQCLNAIKSFHANGYFLSDTQPTNFAIGTPEFNQTRKIFVLNVYMAKKYKKHDGTLIDVFWSSPSSFRDRYKSISHHEKQKIRCIDEIESWFYMIVEWTCGRLPWVHGLVNFQRNMLKMKQYFLTDGEKSLDGCPSEYLQILKLIRENQDNDYYNKSIYKQSFEWKIKESLLLQRNFSLGTFESTDFKYINKHKKAIYRIKLYQRGIPHSHCQFGSWIVLKLVNHNLDTNIEVKYTVKIPSANFTKKFHHIFEKNKEWEMHGCKIEELFNPKKKYFVDGIMNLKFEFQFVEVEKDFVEKINNLSIGTTEEARFDKSPDKAVYYFCPLWRSNFQLQQIKNCMPNQYFKSPVYVGCNEFKCYFELYPKLEESNDFEDGA